MQVEARLARREEAKAREESPDRVAGITNILGGDDSFAAAKARWVGVRWGVVWWQQQAGQVSALLCAAVAAHTAFTRVRV